MGGERGKCRNGMSIRAHAPYTLKSTRPLYPKEHPTPTPKRTHDPYTQKNTRPLYPYKQTITYAKKDTHLAKEHTRALGYHWDIIAQAIPLGVACA